MSHKHKSDKQDAAARNAKTEQSHTPTKPAAAGAPSSVPPHVSLAFNGKDEMNLAEFPIARLGRNDTRLTIEYHGQIIDKTGGVLEQKWIVSGSAPFGLPTEFADRVLVALMVLTAREDFQDRKIPFTIYRVLSLLGLTHNKRNYEAVEKALHQLVGVTIYSEGAFWDKARQKRVTAKKGFHLIEEFWLKSSETDEAVIEEEGVNGYVIWGERIWESFKAGYIKNLDIEFYYSLRNTIARRLYRFLDKRMHYQDTYQIDIFDLAARLGMKPYRYPSDLTRKMKPAFAELQNRGYLADVEVFKVGKFTRVKFVRTGAAQSVQLPLADAATEGAGIDFAADFAEDPKNGGRNDTQNGRKRRSDGHSGEKRAKLGIGTQKGEKTAGGAQNAGLATLYAEYDTTEALKQTWMELLQEFQRALPAGSYRMIADSALLAVEDEEAVIAIDARCRDWIARQMQQKLVRALSAQLDAPITTIAFVTLPT